ncbi:MAG: DUF3078 domain-containing protein [Candidatus Syntrophosphaera sp.]|nr:DUF3078 domain-containing protein [Candidatus Syntrophosphaera sp.]
MKHIKILILTLTLIGISLLAAEPWKLDSDVMFNFTQTAFSDNWAGSELSNITWAAASNTTAQKQMKDWLLNKTSLKLAFGQSHLQKEKVDPVTLQTEKYWEAPLKSTDKIDLESLMQFTLSSFVDPYVAVRMESQFLDEDGDETLLVNPMLFTESAGIMKTLINAEKTKLDVRVGGAVREFVDRRDDDVPIDGGLEAIADFKHVFTALNASYNSRLSAYQAFFNSKSDELNEDWKALDYKWENMLSFKLWKMLSLNLTADLIYDKEVVDELRWKEMLGIGFSYVLF